MNECFTFMSVCTTFMCDAVEVRTRILKVLGMVSSRLRAAVLLSIVLSFWPFKDFFFNLYTISRSVVSMRIWSWGMVAHIFNLGAYEAQAGGCLLIGGQPSLCG